MAQNIKVLVNTGNEQTNKAFDVASGSGKAGKPTTIKAIKGARYQFEDLAAKNVGPESIRSKRVGKNLHVMLEGGQEADLIIENFYDDAMLSENNRGLYGRAEDGKLYEYIPEDPRLEGMPINLADGAKPVSQVLGGGQVGDGFALSGVILAAGAGSVAGAGGLGFSALTVGAAAVGAAALGGGGGGGATTAPSPAQTALAKIEAYNNGNGTNPAAPTLQDYATAGITGVTADSLAAVNATVLAQNTGGADTAPEVQALVNGISDALAKIEAYNNGNGTSPVALTVQDYADAGITGVTADNLAAVNANVLAQNALGADTIPEVQALVTAANTALAKIEDYNNGNGTTPAALTSQDYANAGITGVTTANLAAVNAKVLAQNTAGADTALEVQALVNGISDALAKIEAYNNGNGTTPVALTVQDYADAGITGVTADNLAAVNANVLAQNALGADTIPEVQALVTTANNALAKIEDYNNGNGTTPAALTVQDYANAGITGVSNANLAAVNAKVLAQNTGGADTVPEVQGLVNGISDALAKIEAYNNGDGTMPAALSAQDYANAGITGVTANNLAAVNAVVLSQAVGGADTIPEVQALVTTANNALAKIEDYNNGNGATPAALTAQDYVNAGITGVNADNLAAVNAQVLAQSTGGADTVAEVQALVTAANNALAKIEAYNNGNGATPAALTLQDYANAGITGVTVDNLPAVNAQVLKQNALGADTSPEVQALVTAANNALAKIENYNNGNGTTPAALTVQDYVDAGITGVTSSNLAAVNAKILAQSTGAADTAPEVQALVDTAAAMAAALETIAAAAQADNATSGNLAASVFATAGVTGVDGTNLSAIRSALDSTPVNGLAADTTAEVQTIVDAYNAIKANADSAATANATQAQYAAVGVTGVDSAVKTSLLGDVVDAKAFADVDTVGELQALATAAAAVMTGAAAGTAPIKAQLEALGITGVTDANLASVQAAIAATADDGTGVDTLSELQTVVNTGAANAAAALSAIAAAAQANNATDANVAASVFATAGVTGVDANNVAAIQSALNDTDVQSAQADTAAKVQTIVDAYNAILAEANDTANTAGNGTADANPASNPTAAQYAAIGVNLGAAPTDAATDTETLALLNAIVGGKQTADADTVAEVQELARIANAIQLTAAGGTPNPALAVADLTKLGLDTTGVNSSNLPTLLAAIAAKSDTGSETDTLAKLQTLVDNLDKVAPTTPASAPASYADNVGTITSTTSTAARTDDDTPGVLVGTGLSDTVSLYVDGVKVAATYDSATGRITPNVALSEGAKSITYTLTDASGNESGQSPAISITVDKTAAVVVADNRTLSEDFVTATGNVSTNDTSKDGTEVYALVGANGSGDVSGTYAGLHMNSNGTYTLSPNSANIHAIAQNTDQAFSYTVTDAAGNTSSSTITFTFTPVNDAPTGTNATIAVLEDGTKPFAGADFGFNDVDANTLSAVIITTLPTAGTLKLNGTNVTLNQSIAVADLGNLVFAPAANVNGNAYTTIGFKVQDNGGTANGGADTSATANTLTINITPVDDAPVLNNTSILAYTENDAAKPINTLVTVSDLDNISLASATVSITTGYVAGQDVLSFTNVSMGNIAGTYASGVMTLTSAGSTATLAEWQAALRAVAYSNTSDAPSTASRTVSYVTNDGQLNSTPVTSTVNLTTLNDAPVINSATTVNLNSVLQDAEAPVNGNTTAGTLVGALLDAITDPDGNVPKGILVTGAGAGYESLYYSTNGGSTWINLTNLTVNNAVFLDANSRIFYKPVAGTTGFKTGAVWYRAWDMTDGVTAGTFIDLDTASTGGSSSISERVYGAMGVNIITATTPVVLDLSRDGVLSYTQVVMDVNGDGRLDQTAWAAAQDGVLVLDKYADGKVHDNSQYAFSQYGAAGSTDLQGLAAGFDGNHDGVLDAKDAKFAQFKVWQDANQNGVSDAGEVRSLGDLGIASIGLTSDNVVRTPAAGVTEAGQSSAVLADSSSMLVADAMFDYTSLDYTLAGTASGDTLHLLGGNTTLDLSSIVAAHHSLTAIDLTGTAVNGATGANTVKLSLADVLGVAADASIANGVHKLTLTGDANDTVELDLSQWANTGATVTEGDHTYAVYNASSTTAAQLLIDQHMLVAQHA